MEVKWDVMMDRYINIWLDVPYNMATITVRYLIGRN